MTTRSLEDAIHRLRPTQRVAIDVCASRADGDTYVDDLAFVAELLVQLMCQHEQGPVGKSIVNAYRALIKTAQNEDIIERLPRVKHERMRPTPYEDIARLRSNNIALDQELSRIRGEFDREIADLRNEIRELLRTVQILSSEREAERELVCHGGAKCSRWPECERCGPPRNE